MGTNSRKLKGYVALSLLIIVCMLIVSAMTFFSPNSTAKAFQGNYTDSTISTNLGEMLIKDYESRTDGKTFNGDVFWKLISQITNVSNPTDSTLIGLGSSEKTSADFRGYNGKDVVVTINNIPWTATYLSQNSSNEPILTLWQADGMEIKYYDVSKSTIVTSTKAPINPTNVYDSLTSATKYPSNLYGASFMATVVLNNGGNYASSIASTLPVVPNENSTYAKFTMPSVKGSLTSFIEVPNNTPYQKNSSKESAKTRSLHSMFNLDSNNDCLGAPLAANMNSSFKYYDNSWVDQTAYLAWGDDRIWLPSFAEVGYGETDGGATSGLWKTSVNQRKTSTSINTTWLRSAYHSDAWACYVLNTAGSNIANNLISDNRAVRPAFHLNLAEVAKHLSKPVTTPDIVSVEKEYDGSEQGVEDEEWYTDADLDNNATVTYYNKKTSNVMATKPKAVGNYEVQITLNSNDYYWTNEPNKLTIKLPFNIVKKKIPYPKFVDGVDNLPEDKLPYNGGNDVYFQLETFDDYIDDIKIEVPSKYGSDVKYNETSQSFTAQKVGKYEMTVTLTDTANTEWEDGTHKLAFEVTKAKVGIAITDDSSSSTLTGERGSKLNLNLDLDHNMVPHDDNSVTVTIYASAEKLPTVKVSGDIVLTNADLSYPLEIDLSSLRAGAQYKLEARTTSKDYEIELEEATLDVTEAPARVVLTWELYSNGSKVRNVYKDKLLSDADKTVALDNAITYDGKAYSLKAKLPNGYSLDTSEGIGGYQVEYANTDNSNVGTNADKYTTTLWLKNNSDGSVEEYSITWEIEKAKYDLSKIKWEYDGKLPYDKINGSTAVLDPKTMPEGLLADYDDNTGANVGEYGTAYVTFRLDSGYDENYILPDEYDPESYIDTNKDFEWTKTWNIVKARIQTGSWKNATQTDRNGNAFDVKVLRDPLADDGIVTYLYYETDSTGKKISEEPLKPEDIVYSDSEVKFYVAKPILVDSRNYELDDSNAESRWFKVGRALTKVTVALESNELEYNTNPRHVKLTVGGESVLPTGAFELTYYEGYTKLNDAPKEVGKYRVEVSLKSDYADKYEIDGDYDFEFEIVKGKIAIDWNTQAKPNVLNLKYGQINGVEYEIVDSEDNVVDYKDLKAGNTYRIRAKIKDDERNHFIFEDGSLETDWQEFSVSANDKLTDPNDPKNPYYPQVDPDLPTDSDPNAPKDSDEDAKNDFEKVIETLKQWWQVIASAISIILIIIFVAKGIGYASKRKQNKKTIDSKYSLYAVSGVGLFGLSMTNWTIIACILMGVAVLAFVFMLLEKRGFKKSQKELEEAREEYDRNQKDIDYRKRESDNQRRDDDLRMLLMSMLGGQANMNNGAQGGYGYAQQGFGMEDMRLMINDAMQNMLPNVTQYLPQQASTNDELVQKFIEQNERNEERMREMSEKNEKRIEKLMEKLAEQKSNEKEVASSNVNDEALVDLKASIKEMQKQMKAVANATPVVVNDDRILQVVEKTEHNDETIKQLLRNQENIMDKLNELSNVKPAEPQIVEKIVEKEVPVEKIVEVPVEVVKEVPVEVEKIVEKEVVKEVKVEVPVEVEKVVEKIVEIPADKPEPKAKKAPAPRLTLDEAYAKLSATQKKIFDTLKAYAMSKDKCKEKKSTYFIVLGQSTVNPLVKLTIKKNTTVALFKMEDEYFKDIRRNAGSDGTKVKVKESEVVVGDMQALATAKEMVDLREDQIERYNEYLKEQRSMKKK